MPFLSRCWLLTRLAREVVLFGSCFFRGTAQDDELPSNGNRASVLLCSASSVVRLGIRAVSFLRQAMRESHGWQGRSTDEEKVLEKRAVLSAMKPLERNFSKQPE